MEICKSAVAGTLESSDAQIWVEPGDGELELFIDSVVEKQYGEEIRRVVLETAASMQVEHGRITVVDKGALNCTLRARLQTAICRASEKSYDFGGRAE